MGAILSKRAAIMVFRVRAHGPKLAIAQAQLTYYLSAIAAF